MSATLYLGAMLNVFMEECLSPTMVGLAELPHSRRLELDHLAPIGLSKDNSHKQQSAHIVQ